MKKKNIAKIRTDRSYLPSSQAPMGWFHWENSYWWIYVTKRCEISIKSQSIEFVNKSSNKDLSDAISPIVEGMVPFKKLTDIVLKFMINWDIILNCYRTSSLKVWDFQECLGLFLPVNYCGYFCNDIIISQGKMLSLEECAYRSVIEWRSPKEEGIGPYKRLE